MSVIPSSQIAPDVLAFQSGREVLAASYDRELDAHNYLFSLEGWRLGGVFPAWDDDGGNIYGYTNSATYTQLSNRSLGGEKAPFHLHRWGGVIRYSRVDQKGSGRVVNFEFLAYMENMDLRITITDLVGSPVVPALVLSRSSADWATGIIQDVPAAFAIDGDPIEGPAHDLLVKAEWKTNSGSGLGTLYLGPFGRTKILKPGDEAEIPRFSCSEW